MTEIPASTSPTYITAAQLPDALAARGISVTPRQAARLVNTRKLPFFPSPIGRCLVTTPALLDRALAEPAIDAERAWSAARAAEKRDASRTPPAPTRRGKRR